MYPTSISAIKSSATQSQGRAVPNPNSLRARMTRWRIRDADGVPDTDFGDQVFITSANNGKTDQDSARPAYPIRQNKIIHFTTKFRMGQRCRNIYCTRKFDNFSCTDVTQSLQYPATWMNDFSLYSRKPANQADEPEPELAGLFASLSCVNSRSGDAKRSAQL